MPNFGDKDACAVELRKLSLVTPTVREEKKSSVIWRESGRNRRGASLPALAVKVIAKVCCRMTGNSEFFWCLHVIGVQ